jgi:hypothetical protein
MVKRRKVLVGFGSVGSGIAIAGCSGEDPESGEESSPEQEENDTESNPEPENEEEETEEESDNSEPENTEEEEEEPEPEPASFEVASYDLPETVEVGEEFNFGITVRNTGGQVGDLTAPIYVRTPDIEWEELVEWTFTDVEPGETAERTTDSSSTLSYINRYEFRLGQSSETAVVQTVSAKVSWGDEYTTPAGYRIRVDEPNLQDTYEYEDFQGNIVDREPDSGEQWAFVNVWVKNETGETTFSPLASEFGLLYGNSQADGDTYLLDEPINKEEPFEGGELQPDVERSGWIAYQLPGDVSENDLTMAWSQDTFNGEIAANWGGE